MDLEGLKSCVYGADTKEEINACYEEYGEKYYVRESLLEKGVRLEPMNISEMDKIDPPVSDLKDLIKKERFWNFVWHGPIQEGKEPSEEVFEDVIDEIEEERRDLKDKAEEYSKFYGCVSSITTQYNEREAERRQSEKNVKNCIETLKE